MKKPSFKDIFGDPAIVYKKPTCVTVQAKNPDPKVGISLMSFYSLEANIDLDYDERARKYTITITPKEK